MKRLLAALTLLLCIFPAWAHKASDAFIYIDKDQSQGRVDMALRDLELALGLDLNRDGQLTWGEVKQSSARIQTYLSSRISLQTPNGPCTLNWQAPALTLHSDGHHAASPFQTNCPTDQPWTLNYQALFDKDALHRGLLQWSHGEQSGLGVFSPQHSQVQLDESRHTAQVFGEYFQQGMLHLWMGYDHMLFLLALLLPAVVRRQQGRWQAATQLKPVLKEVICVVSLFTLAHSLTLGLAALELVQLPSTLVETLIALSITLAGLQVLYPVSGQRRHWLAFGFGLIHGFGFASVLFDLTPSAGQRVLALAGFNLGVEAAQLILVLVTIPVLFWLRQSRLYQHWIMPGSAWSIAALGLVWAWQRSMG